LVLVIVDHNRFLEWRLLLEYLRDNEEELVKKGRMTALVLCLQRHWQEAVKEVPDWF